MHHEVARLSAPVCLPLAETSLSASMSAAHCPLLLLAARCICVARLQSPYSTHSRSLISLAFAGLVPQDQPQWKVCCIASYRSPRYWITIKCPDWCIECPEALRCISERNFVLSSKQTILAVCLRHRIPAMVDHSAGDLPIFESGAIMWYLGKQHDPHGKLFPKASICNTRASCSGLGSFRQRPALTPPLRILTLPRCKGLGCSRLHNAQMAS